MPRIPKSRRQFLKNSGALAASGILTSTLVGSCKPNNSKKAKIVSNNKPKNASIIGHGDFKYKVHADWGVQDSSKIPVKDCHEMVQDSKGRLILLTNHIKNNVITYDRSGKVLSTWGKDFPGAHGLTLSKEGGEDFLFITDHDRHQVFKTTIDGKILMTLDYPKETGVYNNADLYKPTEVCIGPNGDIYVADGYGENWIIQYSSKGEYIRHFGGKGENDNQFNCCHGVTFDTRNPDRPELLITSRASKEFKRFSLDGEHLETIPLNGCEICRPVIHGDELYFAVIVTKSWWSYDGMVIVLDKNNKIISAPGGSTPNYVDGQLQEITYDGTFLNPHDVCIDNDKNIYVAQWYSGKTYPVMLERV